MKLLICILLSVFHLLKIPVINAFVDKSADYYETSIEGYKKNEFWGNWSMPLSNRLKALSNKQASNKASHRIVNVQDYNLNTAWIFEYLNQTPINYLEFTFKFPQNSSYAGAYQFQGICNLFNGYCKTQTTWNQYCRIKTLLVRYNNKAIYYILLKDTWHFQSFDISKYFVNRRERKNLKAPYEIKNSDKLRFEIVDIYPGTKYKGVAVSEFLCEGGGN